MRGATESLVWAPGRPCETLEFAGDDEEVWDEDEEELDELCATPAESTQRSMAGASQPAERRSRVDTGRLAVRRTFRV